MRPLPSIPYIYLPTSNRAILLVTNIIIVPTMKSNKATRRADFRLLIYEKDTYKG